MNWANNKDLTISCSVLDIGAMYLIGFIPSTVILKRRKKCSSIKHLTNQKTPQRNNHSITVLCC